MPRTNGMVVFFLGLVALGAFLRSLVAAVMRHRLYREALMAEIALRHKLLDKLTSVEDLRTYLDSTARPPLTDLLEPRPDESYRRVVRTAVTGCVLVIVGLACLGTLLMIGRVGSPWRGAPLLFFFGFVGSVTAGAAFLASAGLSYRMLKAWNLLQSPDRAASPVSP